MLKLLSIDLYFRKSGSGNINLLNMLSKIESANSKNNAGYYAETTSTIPPFRYVRTFANNIILKRWRKKPSNKRHQFHFYKKTLSFNTGTPFPVHNLYNNYTLEYLRKRPKK